MSASFEAVVSALRDAVELAKWWRKRCRALERRMQKAAGKLKDAVAELDGVCDPRAREVLLHVQSALELLEAQEGRRRAGKRGRVAVELGGVV